MNKIKDKIKKGIPYYFLIIATIVMCLPLLRDDLNLYRDDGIQHICRLMGTYETLQEGEFLPLIMSKFCNNFGYSWNIFYSPLTAYVPLIFKILNMSFVNCIKMFMFVVTFLSGLTMYNFVRKLTNNKNIATLAGVIYILAPYRVTDMYIRNALAELTSFIFIPLIFEGLYTIVNKKEKTKTLILGAAGLILTHTVIAMYVAIFCIIYLIVFFKELTNKKVIKELLISVLLILALTAFFLVPLLEHKIAAEYEVFVPGRMIDEEKLEILKTDFYQLFFTKQDQIMVFAIGLVTVVGLILTPVVYKKIDKNIKKTYLYFLIIGLILTLITLRFFPFEKFPNILKMLQFTFRLYEFTSCFFAIVSAINYSLVIKNFSVKDITVLSIIIALLLIPYKNKIEYGSYRDENDYYPAVNVTENTGRVHAGMASMEYLPSKAFNNLEYIINRKDEPILLEGQAKIENYEKNGTNLKFNIVSSDNSLQIELPYIYYLGYRVYINGEEIKYVESKNGFIQINLSGNLESSMVIVKYTGTNLTILSYIVSGVSALVLILQKVYIKLRR